MIQHPHVQQRRWPEPRSSSRPACRSVFQLLSRVSSLLTDRPLCKSQVHLSTALSSQSLVFLERPTHDTGSDCEVTVVAVSFVSRQSSGLVDYMAYEMPAAFHANAIVIEQEECVLEWESCWCWSLSMFPSMLPGAIELEIPLHVTV
jgi:hypothetical protein